MIESIIKNDYASLRLLANNSADINEIDTNGFSALAYAKIWKKDHLAVSILEEFGATLEGSFAYCINQTKFTDSFIQLYIKHSLSIEKSFLIYLELYPCSDDVVKKINDYIELSVVSDKLLNNVIRNRNKDLLYYLLVYKNFRLTSKHWNEDLHAVFINSSQLQRDAFLESGNEMGGAIAVDLIKPSEGSSYRPFWELDEKYDFPLFDLRLGKIVANDLVKPYSTYDDEYFSEYSNMGSCSDATSMIEDILAGLDSGNSKKLEVIKFTDLFFKLDQSVREMIIASPLVDSIDLDVYAKLLADLYEQVDEYCSKLDYDCYRDKDTALYENLQIIKNEFDRYKHLDEKTLQILSEMLVNKNNDKSEIKNYSLEVLDLSLLMKHIVDEKDNDLLEYLLSRGIKLTLNDWISGVETIFYESENSLRDMILEAIEENSVDFNMFIQYAIEEEDVELFEYVISKEVGLTQDNWNDKLYSIFFNATNKLRDKIRAASKEVDIFDNALNYSIDNQDSKLLEYLLADWWRGEVLTSEKWNENLYSMFYSSTNETRKSILFSSDNCIDYEKIVAYAINEVSTELFYFMLSQSLVNTLSWHENLFELLYDSRVLDDPKIDISLEMSESESKKAFELFLNFLGDKLKNIDSLCMSNIFYLLVKNSSLSFEYIHSITQSFYDDLLRKLNLGVLFKSKDELSSLIKLIDAYKHAEVFIEEVTFGGDLIDAGDRDDREREIRIRSKVLVEGRVAEMKFKNISKEYYSVVSDFQELLHAGIILHNFLAFESLRKIKNYLDKALEKQPANYTIIDEGVIVLPDEDYFKSFISKYSTYGTTTPVHIAVRYNNIFMLCAIENIKSMINFKNHYGETPLMIAIQKNNEKIVDFLIANSAELNVQIDTIINTDEEELIELMITHFIKNKNDVEIFDIFRSAYQVQREQNPPYDKYIKVGKLLKQEINDEIVSNNLTEAIDIIKKDRDSYFPEIDINEDEIPF